MFIGNKAHELEIKINRRILAQGSKSDFYIKPLSDEAALNKGIELFLEVFVVYILLTFLTIHEMKKSAEKSKK